MFTLSTAAERLVQRLLLAELKAAVKVDSAWIRAEKPVVRQLQRECAPDARARQAALDRSRFEARARLVVYGLIRGRAWGQMERNHPHGDQRLIYALKRVWNATHEAVHKATTESLAMPEVLRAHLPSWLQ